MSKAVYGVVLAGGRSKRMGMDKALLTINRQSMIERTCALLASTSVDKVIVSRNEQQSSFVSDLIPQKGPLSGIHSVALQFTEQNLVFVPVDLPLLTASSIENLITAGRNNQANVRFEGYNLPLFLNNTVQVRSELAHTLQHTKSYSVGGFCSRIKTIDLANAPHDELVNTNTPEQWEDAFFKIKANKLTHIKEEKYEQVK